MKCQKIVQGDFLVLLVLTHSTVQNERYLIFNSLIVNRGIVLTLKHLAKNSIHLGHTSIWTTTTQIQIEFAVAAFFRSSSFSRHKCVRFRWFLPPTGVPCSLEVAFILDSSESAKIFLFEKQKSFVLSFSTRLAMLQIPGWTLRVQMAALQYSSSVSIEQRFSAWKDLDSFHGRVSTMNYIGHGTYTTYAITNASQLLVHETQADSVKVAVLMTDGVDHPRNPDVIAAAAEAKGHGIKFFAVGLSNIAQQSQNQAKLRAIASTPAQQFVQSLLNPQLEEKLLKEMVSAGFK